jgi:predicted permease
MFWYKYATPGYFEAMGISVVAGRAFERADHEQNLGNIVVSQALADRLWPGESALGKRLRIEGDTTALGWEHIIGVVESTRGHGLREDPLQMIYHAIVGPRRNEGYGTWNLTYALRAEDPTQLVPAVRHAVRETDPNLPIAGIRTVETVVADSIIQLTFTALALGIAALMALILGAVGLYGVLSYVVSQRTQEMGVRLALGARAGQVQGLVVASGARLALLGLIIGLAGAGALTRLLQGLLFGVEPLDPVTFLGMSLVLLAVGLLASYVPARRAAQVDPVESMRME